MSEIDLRPFCSTNPYRPFLHNPFSIGEFSYATDGCVLIRVPRRSAVNGYSGPPLDIDAPLACLSGATFTAVPSVNLPLAVISDCTRCRGRGFEHDCPDCTCECEFCVDGKASSDSRVSLTLRSGLYQLRYIRLLFSLPDLELPPVMVATAPAPFRFAGGVGCIMGLSERHSNHLDLVIP